MNSIPWVRGASGNVYVNAQEYPGWQKERQREETHNLQNCNTELTELTEPTELTELTEPTERTELTYWDHYFNQSLVVFGVWDGALYCAFFSDAKQMERGTLCLNFATTDPRLAC